MQADNLRQIIRSRRFEADMSHIEPEVRRADEYCEGLEWVLARDPLAVSEPIADSDGVHVTYIERLDEFKPPIAVFFLFDAETVELLGAFVDEDAER